jgi:SAM-dependent methyltransferase
MIVRRVRAVFEAGGLGGVVRALARRIVTPRARAFRPAVAAVRTGAGLEIGGPSPIFARGGLLPLYPQAARLDNLNFASRTIWEGAIAGGDSFVYDRRRAPGTQHIGEGSDLSAIGDARYDFVLSSHMLEHTANPLKALVEWKRVLRLGGTLVLVLPHGSDTFDHRRPVTTLAHLRDDLARGTGEDDLTHVAEILALHDVVRDPGVGDETTFRARAACNHELRSLHHHVFDEELARAAVTEAGFAVASVERVRPYHIVLLATKPTVAS